MSTRDHVWSLRFLPALSLVCRFSLRPLAEKSASFWGKGGYPEEVEAWIEGCADGVASVELCCNVSEVQCWE